MNKPKKPIDQKGAGVSNSQVETQDVGTQNQNLEKEVQDVGTQTRDVETETQDVETETQDVGTQTRDVETQTQDVGTQIDPSPIKRSLMPRQKSLQLPNRFENVKREKIKNPSFFPEIDKPPSESKTAALPEEAIDSGITSDHSYT